MNYVALLITIVLFKLNYANEMLPGENGEHCLGNNEPMDLILQEISELQKLIEYEQNKINLLESLKITLLNTGQPISYNFEASELNLTQLLNQDTISKKKTDSSAFSKTSTPELNFNQVDSFLQNRLIKKYDFPLAKDIIKFAFVSVKPYKNKKDETNSNFVLIGITQDSNIQLFDMGGHLFQEYNRTCLFKNFGASPLNEDSFIALLNEKGQIEIFNIFFEKKKIEIPNQDEQNASHINKFMIEASLNQSKVFEIGSAAPYQFFNHMLVTFSKGVKYLIFSDTNGTIHHFNSNGVYGGSYNTGENPILALFKSSANVVVATSRSIQILNQIGYSNYMNCELVFEEIAQVIPDHYFMNYFYVLNANHTVFVYQISSQCKIIYKFSLKQKIKNAGEIHPIMYSMKNYLLIQLNTHENKFLIFNMSGIDSNTFSNPQGQLIELFDLPSTKINYMTIQRTSQTSNNIYIVHTPRESNNQHMAIFEFSVPIPKSSDFYENLRIPIIIGIIVLSLMFNIWWRGSRRKNKQNIDIDEFYGEPELNKMKEKTKLGNKEDSNYEDKIDELLKKTTELGQKKNKRNDSDDGEDILYEKKKNQE